jgi:hypothetical protein
MPSPDRLKAESARAFAAFCTYRDLGPGRSLLAAWQQHNSDAGATRLSRKCPGQWQRWSVRWQWVERAREFDVELDAVKREARAARYRQLEQERADYEHENHGLLWNNMLDMDALLKKAGGAPITDITQAKEEVVDGKRLKSTNKVKGVNLSGYARLVHERNETARQAIEGVRKNPAASNDDREVERVVLKTRRP